MKSLIVFLATILIAIAVGTACEYLEINKFIKYALMAVAITLSLRLFGFRNQSNR